MQAAAENEHCDRLRRRSGQTAGLYKARRHEAAANTGFIDCSLPDAAILGIEMAMFRSMQRATRAVQTTGGAGNIRKQKCRPMLFGID
jgi:hypothetical protein